MKALPIVPILLLAACSPRQPSPSAQPEIFRDVSQETGLIFQHENGATGEFYMPEIMGAGAAMLDFDNDGDLDIFLVQSKGSSRLYRNELMPGGALKFADVSAASGIDYDGYGMGAATGDIDNDGRVDLLVTGWGKTRLYRNLGDGRFAPVPAVFPPTWSTSASFFDYDRDGRLDLIVLSYVDFSTAINKKCQAPTGEADYCTPRAYSPVSARLYHNETTPKDEVRLVDVTAKSGIDRALGPGLGVVALDLNADGWPDLFIANDTAQNHLWINQRNGTFREAGIEAGVGYSEDGLAKAGMGVAAGDYDQDGSDDLFVLNLMREGATLLRNDGAAPSGLPSFVDVSRASGIYQATFAFTGFGTGWIDYDNDGQLDLFLANGAVTLREEQRGKPRPFQEKNLMLRNDRGKFTDVSAKSGSVFDLAEVSRGAAFGDLDNDGDIDIVVTNNQGPARLYRNDSPPTGWLSVRLEGKTANRSAIGARVTVFREDLRPLVRHVHSDTSYCSANDLRVHFGLGDKAGVDAIEVNWPDGRIERWIKPAVRTVLRLGEGEGASVQ